MFILMQNYQNYLKQVFCEKWPKNKISEVNFSDLQ